LPLPTSPCPCRGLPDLRVSVWASSSDTYPNDVAIPCGIFAHASCSSRCRRPASSHVDDLLASVHRLGGETAILLPDTLRSYIRIFLLSVRKRRRAALGAVPAPRRARNGTARRAPPSGQ